MRKAAFRLRTQATLFRLMDSKRIYRVDWKLFFIITNWTLLMYNSLKTEVSGGPVDHCYNFLQFHMHWGDSIERGSEHLLDGKAFSAEVFWDLDLKKVWILKYSDKNLVTLCQLEPWKI